MRNLKKKNNYEDIHILEVIDILLKYKIFIILFITLSIFLGFYQTRNIENNYLSTIKITPLSKNTHDRDFGYFNSLTENPNNFYIKSYGNNLNVLSKSVSKKIVPSITLSNFSEEFIYELRRRDEFIDFFKKFDHYNTKNYNSVDDLNFDISNDISNIEIKYNNHEGEEYWLVEYTNQNPEEYQTALINTLDSINSKLIYKINENYSAQIQNLEKYISFIQEDMEKKINIFQELNEINSMDQQFDNMNFSFKILNKDIIGKLKDALDMSPLSADQSFKLMDYSTSKITTKNLGSKKFQIIFIYLLFGFILSIVSSLFIHHQKNKN